MLLCWCNVLEVSTSSPDDVDVGCEVLVSDIESVLKTGVILVDEVESDTISLLL